MALLPFDERRQHVLDLLSPLDVPPDLVDGLPYLTRNAPCSRSPGQRCHCAAP